MEPELVVYKASTLAAAISFSIKSISVGHHVESRTLGKHCRKCLVTAQLLW